MRELGGLDELQPVLGSSTCAIRLHNAGEMPMLSIMNTITLTQTTPLFEDKDGTIRIIGSRIPLDPIVMSLTRGQLRNRCRTASRACHSAAFTELSPFIWNTRLPLRRISAAESKKP